jgi:uncharacterized protein (DUF2147 family)
MTRRHSLLAGAILIAAVASAILVAEVGSATASEPSMLGRWARGDGKARVRVERCGSAICAINTWIRPGDASEKVGDKLVINVKPVGATQWTGQAFDPQRNRRYRVKIDVAQRSINTKGCVWGGLLCKTMTWTRLGPAN